MTLTEIYKIIDEADYVHIKSPKEERFNDVCSKRINKESLEPAVKCGYVFTYYKRNEETGEMTLLAKVDHIDKEKKIVKKKLGEMSDEEIKQVRDKFCKDGFVCHACPFSYSRLDPECLAWFNTWKERIENTKDKEFDVEVEE